MITKKRPRSKLNNAPKEVIDKQFLEESPEGFDPVEQSSIVIAKDVPRMETIQFRNDRDPGVELEFHYATKTHPLHIYKLQHGGIYTLPVEVIEHLESRIIPNYIYKKDENGIPQLVVSSNKHMFTCKTIRSGRAA